MFEIEIDDYSESLLKYITKKGEARSKLMSATAELTILMAQHIEKSSSSFDNKLQLLLKIKEIHKEVRELVGIYYNNEAEWKNYRDFARLYEIKIMELQSRRKALIVNGV